MSYEIISNVDRVSILGNDMEDESRGIKRGDYFHVGAPLEKHSCGLMQIGLLRDKVSRRGRGG